MITRTTVRGTAMTGVGCSAPTLATAAVERPLLYDALIAIADTGWWFDEQTNAGPPCRGASLRRIRGWRQPRHARAAHRIRRGTVDLPGCGRPHSVASNPNVGEAGAHSPWKSRGRSWYRSSEYDPCTTRGSCDAQRGLDDHEA